MGKLRKINSLVCAIYFVIILPSNFRDEGEQDGERSRRGRKTIRIKKDMFK